MTETYEIKLRVSRTLQNRMTEALLDLGFQGVAEEQVPDEATELTMTTYTSDPALISRVTLPYTHISTATIQPDQWKNKWMEGLKGFALHPAIWVQPFTDKDWPEKHYPIMLKLDPRDAFGDGRHPTTRMCARMIFDYIDCLTSDEIDEVRFLDIGTGTGILTILAQKMGVRQADAFDCDPEAVTRARENARLNNTELDVYFEEDVAEYFTEEPYHLIVANLLTELQLQHLSDMIHYLSLDGQLILSGIGSQWREEMEDCITSNGLTILQVDEADGWLAYWLEHKHPIL